MLDPFEEIVRFAIDKEEEAASFYDMAAGIAGNPISAVFKELAGVERGHKRMLEGWNREVALERSTEEVRDLRIGDYLVEVPVAPDMSYQDVLIVAMKREERAFALYSVLAELSKDHASRQLFQTLAHEEAKHKLRFETEYDKVVLSED
jgi:rubrerythrin